MELNFAIWRHPLPRGVVGLCLGRCDVSVDARKAKRLAHRIRRFARAHGWPRVVITSPLQRSHGVGRWLRRWGWRHVFDERLSEMDFGAWDGVPWRHIGADAVAAWCDDFARHAPGGGETVAALLQRCGGFVAHPGVTAPFCVVGHAGWISALSWAVRGEGRDPTPAEWPAAVAYGRRFT